MNLAALGARCRPIQSWPGQLTKHRMNSPFRATFTATTNLLLQELRHLRAKEVILQLAVGEEDITVDGSRPKANARAQHPGVILAAKTRHGPLQIACDRFRSWEDNLRAIALGLGDLRRLDRYGISKRGEQYAGWRALPAPGPETPSAEQAVRTLWEAAFPGRDGCNVEAVLENPTRAQSLWRQAVLRTHPDSAGGTAEAFHRVSEAWRILRQRVGVVAGG